MIKKLIHRYFSSHSIRSLYISFIMIFIILPMLAITLFSFYFTRNIIKEDYSAQYRDAIQNEIEKQLSFSLKHTHLVIQNILTYNDIYVALDSEETYESTTEIIEKQLSRFLHEIETISGIELYTHSGQHYSYFKKDIEPCKNPSELFKEVSPSTLCISDECTTDGKNYYLMIGGKLFNFYNSYSLGDFIVYINLNSLQTFYQNLYDNGCEAFLTINGKIISHPDKAMIGKDYYLPERVKDYVNTTDSFSSGYVVASRDITLMYLSSPISLQTIISYNAILKDITKTNTIVYTMIIVLFIISLIPAVVIANKLTGNIRTLQKNVTDVEAYLDEQNTLLTSIPPKNELFLLENSFEEMRQRINLLLKENNKMMDNLRIAELNALQAQINPHFVYNALAAVSWTAKLQKQTQIVKLVSALSSYFRIGLHGGEMFITIKEELKHVQSYIYVEQIRFPELFDVVYNIDDEIMDYYITKIVLQPLVENSIKHGFKKRKVHGQLVINGFVDENNDIILEVIDNGRGCETNPLNFSREEASGHYGLKNVSERLKITYGDGYGLSFSSIPNRETRVSIKLKKTKNITELNGGKNV